MPVILSGGILTGLTGTMIQAAPVYAETEDCEDNDDKNCNERSQDIYQKDNCRVENGSGSADGDDGGAGGSTENNDNRFECTNNLEEPNTGDVDFNEFIE
jgi:hypothetical protein